MPRTVLIPGTHIFSYRLIAHWERSLLIDNAYYGTTHKLSTNPVLIQVVDRIDNTVMSNQRFRAKPVVRWYTYQYRADGLVKVYLQKHIWMKIAMPNTNSTFDAYLPDDIDYNDTLMFEAEDMKEPRLV